MPRRRIRRVAVAVVAGLVLATALIAPAQSARAVKASYQALPPGVRDAVPNGWENVVGRWIDGVSRALTFGQPSRLIQLDLRLEGAAFAPGAWGGNHDFWIRWGPLGSGIDYDVQLSHSRTGPALVVDAGRFPSENASFEFPGDGDWYVRVRPVADGLEGRTTVFGPFRIDSTPPVAPLLSPIPPPPGYSFSLQWQPVSDSSGVVGYQVERRGSGSLFQVVARVLSLGHAEEQMGNGHYSYRVRAINGAGLLSGPSNVQGVDVRAPMSNPGRGEYEYGIQANYTSFMKIWDLSNPNRYARTDQVPDDIRDQWLGGGWGFETTNQTLVQRTKQVVGAEKNTMLVAQRLFIWLFDYADYDVCRVDPTQSQCASRSLPVAQEDGLQRAGLTYDRRLGICGDLATLYITMLRIAGVPARPVHGYLDNAAPGEDGALSIGDFHVWVEVWVGASLRSQNGDDTSEDWMTVDVSGISGPYEPSKLMIYFGIFNPEYLALGTEADYDDPGWNSWAQFGWSRSGLVETKFVAGGQPTELYAEEMNLFFDPLTKKRALVDVGRDPPGPEYTRFFEGVKVLSKKRIDYGVNVSGGRPTNATIEVRYPLADAFAAVLPWQSVIYTIYSNSDTLDGAAAGRGYTRLTADGFAVWEDDFR